MATELIDLDNCILYAIKKLKRQHQRADIEHIFSEMTKTIDFEHLTKDSLSDRVELLLCSNKIVNKINRNRDSFFLNEDAIDMTIIDMIPYTRHSPTNNIFEISDSFDRTPSINAQKDFLETPQKAKCSLYDNEIDQSELFIDKMFEEVKLNELKNLISKQISKDIKVLIQNELVRNSSTFNEKSHDELYKREINILKEDIKNKESIIKELLKTIKEIQSKPITLEPIPSFTLSNDIEAESENRPKNSYIEQDPDNEHNEIISQNVNNNNNSINSIKKQLDDVLKEKKEKYYQHISSCISITGELPKINDEDVPREKQGIYPDGTVVVIGDSILNGVMQERLSRKGRPVKVHNFRGASVDDLWFHVIPIIRKKPSYIIIHAGTVDACYSKSREILDKLLSLKSFITSKLPNCQVSLSTPTIRFDDGYPSLVVRQLTNHILELNIGIVDNRNITGRNIGKKGLHLNQTGTNLLAKNISTAIKSF